MTTQPRRGGRRSRTAWTAAATLGWAVLFFVCFQLAANVALEKWPLEVRDKEYAWTRACIRTRLAERPGRPLVVALGSSRMMMAFRPQSLPPCETADGRRPVVVNGGLLGAGPVLQLIVLRRLLADGIHPDWVLIECWPRVWSQSVERGESNVWIERLSWRDLRLVARYSADPHRLYGDWLQDRLLPCVTHRTAFLKEYFPRALHPRVFRDDRWRYGSDGTGWVACPFGATPDRRTRLAARARREYQEVFPQYRHSDPADRALREILDVCRQHRIAAVLVVLPESAGLRECYPPEVSAEVGSYLERVHREYRVPLIDAHTWLDDAGNYADGYHMLARGADAFTRRFGREVLQPLLAGRPLPPAASRQEP
jgi:hypothetical protein